MSFFKEFFTVSRSEKIGILLLLFIMVTSIAIYFLIDYIPIENKNYDYSQYKKQIEDFESESNLIAVHQKSKNNYYSGKKIKKQFSSFQFDPNSINYDSLLLLGFNEKLAERLINYRNSGGKFIVPGDIKKIYGLNEILYNRIEKYIKIQNNSNEKVNHDLKNAKLKTQIININDADSVSLLSLSGIGPKLAHRIIAYRNSLGGFHSIEQLKEVYGISNELLLSIKDEINAEGNIIQIKINNADAKSIYKIPYIKNWNIANAIVSYRQKHGNYSHALDLMKTDLVSEELCRKIAPYLSFE